MPNTTETRPTLLEHIVRDDGTIQEVPARPVVDPTDERPTYREHRITRIQRLIALGIFLGAPTVGWVVGWVVQWVVQQLYEGHQYLQAEALQDQWEEDEAAAQVKASQDLTNAIKEYQIQLQHQETAQKAKTHWAHWGAAFLGNQKATCYHSNTFQDTHPGGTYTISCQVGPQGEIPKTKVVCTPQDCVLSDARVPSKK